MKTSESTEKARATFASERATDMTVAEAMESLQKNARKRREARVASQARPWNSETLLMAVGGSGASTLNNTADQLGSGATIDASSLVDPESIGFGGYALVSRVGVGAMGEVWRAIDKATQRPAALKIFRTDICLSNEARELIQNGCERASRLTHAGIVRIHGYLEASSMAAVAMEFAEGANLASLKAVRDGKFFEAEELYPLVDQLCRALSYAHRVGVVHGDLAPDNILVSSQGEIKILDFGIAAPLNLVAVAGHLRHIKEERDPYKSPQQLINKTPQPSDDIYAIGAILYELLSGEPPYALGEHGSHGTVGALAGLRAQRLKSGRTGEKIPQAWEEVTQACLANEASRRPALAVIANRLRPTDCAIASPHIKSADIATRRAELAGTDALQKWLSIAEKSVRAKGTERGLTQEHDICESRDRQTPAAVEVRANLVKRDATEQGNSARVVRSRGLMDRNRARSAVESFTQLASGFNWGRLFAAPVNILVMGPVASGKSCLIHSMARSLFLEEMESENRHREAPFRVHRSDGAGRLIDDAVQHSIRSIPVSDAPRAQSLRLDYRSFLGLKQSATFRITDSPGGYLWPEYSGDAFFDVVRGASGLLYCIDPSDAAQNTRDTFRFVSSLVSREIKLPRIVFVLTKADLFFGGSPEPFAACVADDPVSRLTEQLGEETLQMFFKVTRRKEISAIWTSSFGFTKEAGPDFALANPGHVGAMQRIADRNDASWNPFQTVVPFLQVAVGEMPQVARLA